MAELWAVGESVTFGFVMGVWLSVSTVGIDVESISVPGVLVPLQAARHMQSINTHFLHLIIDGFRGSSPDNYGEVYMVAEQSPGAKIFESRIISLLIDNPQVNFEFPLCFVPLQPADVPSCP